MINEGQVTRHLPPIQKGIQAPDFGTVRRNEKFVLPRKEQNSNRLFCFQRTLQDGSTVQSTLIASIGQTMADLVKRLQKQSSSVLRFTKQELAAIKGNTRRIVFILEQLDRTPMSNSAFGQLTTSELLESIQERPIKIALAAEYADGLVILEKSVLPSRLASTLGMVNIDQKTKKSNSST
eukprot:CAMPEP_0119019102 /NCGR_PEP_ID=MMETSP1176-20130426/20981_1 /TAXON_ID=265551 /ORGANISM="Synedropsis recta cf, Strain CCMP1620" /LENGTH=179 /DNA_ID=CAMNT_0006973237 /DNA_START=1 /DNA_END=536 /DNA_ORIENTATION=+